MALVPNRPAAVVRRVTTWSLAVDVAVSLLVGIFISSLVGFVLFVAGLIVIGFVYYNFTRVMKTRGLR